MDTITAGIANNHAWSDLQILETLLGGKDLSEQQTQEAMEVWPPLVPQHHLVAFLCFTGLDV